MMGIENLRQTWFRGRMVVVFTMLLMQTADCFGICIQHEPANKKDTIPLDPRVLHGKLANGFAYYVRNTGHEGNTVEIRFVVKVGFQCEELNEFEVSHLIEHAAFGKTKNFENIVSYMNDQGLQLGIDYGATTGLWATNYWFRIPSPNKKLVVDCLRMIRDWSGDIVLDSASVAREKMTVLNEIAVPQSAQENDSPIDFGFRRDARAAEVNIKNVSNQTVANFYRKWYTPDLQAVIITGDISEGDILREIRLLLGDIQIQKKYTRTIPSLGENVAVEPQVVIQPLSSSTGLLVQQIWRRDRLGLFTKADYQRKTIIDLFNQMMDSRIRDVVCSGQDKSGMVSTIRFNRSYQSPGGQDALIATVQLSSREKKSKIRAEIKSMFALQNALLSDKLSTVDLATAKKALRYQTAAIDSAKAAADGYENHFSNGEPFLDFRDGKALVDSVLTEISLADIHAAIKEWTELYPDVIVRGCRQDIPSCPDKEEISRIVRNVENVHITFSGESNASRALGKTQQNIDPTRILEYRKHNSGVTKARYITLANGAEIILRKFKPLGGREDKVLLEAFKKGGASQYSGNDYFAALHAARIAYAGGLGEWSKRELMDYFSCRDISLYPFVLDRYVGFRGESFYRDFESMIQVLRLMFNPEISRRTFDTYIKQANKMPDSESTVYDSIMGVYTMDRSLMMDMNSSLAKRLDLESVRHIYREFFSDLDDFVFVVTGDFDVDEVESMFVRNLSDIQPPTIPVATAVSSVQNPGSNVLLPDRAFQILQSEAGGKTVIAFYFLKTQTATVDDKVGRKILCDVLNAMLYKRLRWEMGSAYFVQVTDDQILENRCRVTVWIDTSYGNPDEMISAVWQEIERLAEDGPDAALLAVAIERQLKRLKSEESTHGFWRSYFLSQVLNGADMDEIGTWENSYQHVDAEKIRLQAVKLLKDVELCKLKISG